MADLDGPPPRRPYRGYLVLFLLTIAGIIAIGAAWLDDRPALGIAAVVFFAVALPTVAWLRWVRTP